MFGIRREKEREREREEKEAKETLSLDIIADHKPVVLRNSAE